jgi:hypothetical protein
MNSSAGGNSSTLNNINSNTNTSGMMNSSQVTSKPPLNISQQQQRAYKMYSHSSKPTLQGWLYKEKHVKHFSTRIGYAKKFKRYWCVLVKDYIAFYKTQDERTPHDFLLLKDFFIKIINNTANHNSSNVNNFVKNNFLIGDKVKQMEHEFYAETSEDFQEWLNVLNEIKIKNIESNGNNNNHASFSSLPHSYSLENASEFGSNSLPTPSNLAKFKQQHSQPPLQQQQQNNLPLSTILGSNEELAHKTSNVRQTSGGGRKISISQNNNNNNSMSYNSSRESSPGIFHQSSASRDSSPSLTNDRNFFFPFFRKKEIRIKIWAQKIDDYRA